VQVTPQRAKTTASLPPNSRWMNRAGPSDLRAYGHLWGSLLACRRRGPLSGRTCPHTPQRAKTTASLPPNSRWMNRAGPSDLRAYGHLWGSLLACRRRGPLSGRTCPHVLAPCRSYPGNNFVIASQHARELCRAQNLGPQRSSGTTASHINGPDCNGLLQCNRNGALRKAGRGIEHRKRGAGHLVSPVVRCGRAHGDRLVC
jgi:hypothetical protein